MHQSKIPGKLWQSRSKLECRFNERGLQFLCKAQNPNVMLEKENYVRISERLVRNANESPKIALA
jgi:hypothetical protein